MRQTLASLTAVVLVACTPDAFRAPEPTLPELSQEGVSAIDAFLESAVDDGRVPKIVAMAANRQGVIYAGAFGKQDVAADIDVELDSIFNLASMTKPVTSAAAMRLAETGVFHLDDPVSAYLPSWSGREVAIRIDRQAGTYETAPAESEITIRQLLSHTSGLAYTFSNATAQALGDITGEDQPVDLPLVSQPGTVWNYSPSTAVLGDLVETISGMPLDEFLATRFFEPLGMSDTFYDVPADKAGRVVTVHRLLDGTLNENPVPETVQSPVRGDGGLFGTAPDYIRFLQMLLNEGLLDGRRVLSEAAVEAMISNQIGAIRVETQLSTSPAVSADFPLGAGRDTFGLGFQITGADSGEPDLRSPGSYSWGGIFNTHFWVDPAEGIAAVILMQQLPFYGPDAMAVYQGFEVRIYQNLIR